MNIVITGGSRGLGAECVKLFEAQGHKVFAPSKGFANLSLNPDIYTGDLVEAVKSELGMVDALINNAAIQGPVGTVAETDHADVLECFTVNLLAPFAICTALLPLMQDGACIVNVSGGGATSARPNYAAYAASKAGLVRFTETLAEELRPRKIRCNAVAPGKMATAMTNFEGDHPRNAAECIAWLCSPKSAPLTGRLISAVHDGWRAPRFAEFVTEDQYTLRRVD